jgi:hypothetical protein
MLPHMADRRALLRKLENVEAFPLIALAALPELRADLDAVEAEALLRARELGASLEDIADALAITRQGVAYKLKALAGNGDAHEDEPEAEVIKVTDQAEGAGPPEAVEDVDEREVVAVAEDADVAEVSEFVEVPDEPQQIEGAEVADEADEEVIDVRAPQTGDRPDVDFRRPHTKA